MKTSFCLFEVELPSNFTLIILSFKSVDVTTPLPVGQKVQVLTDIHCHTVSTSDVCQSEGVIV